MEKLGLNQIREEFLSFFEKKGHLRLNSFPLMPQGDNSLLLINSGMAPMKKWFLGTETPPKKRVTTCQKCIRTPDIERVGKTSRHGTFFEMLGNFSFGDYFKHEATAWAWEFFTEVMKLPADKLYVSVFLDDDEAWDIWTKEVGIPESHMVRLGREDNFWEIGSGPCGPCSEIYFDRGAERGCGSTDCAVGCECDRFVEIWNLVFSQLNSDGEGNYAPMEHPNIDTGMGLERLACVMQGVDNLFEVDTIADTMKHISDIAGVKYKENEKTDISLRVITDHIRSGVFMISDGVLPSAEGRGYVLRRLLRRAARHGRLLGIRSSFLSEVAATVARLSEAAYPELTEKLAYIQKIISSEETAFAKTIDRGLALLNELMEQRDISGDDAFKLNDTFGFPLDLTREIAEEKGVTVDVERFEELLSEQKARARAAREAAGDTSWEDSTLDAQPTEFVGYDTLSTEGTILYCDKKGGSTTLVLDKTPFYATSGGQIADTGIISSDSVVIKVSDVKKDGGGRFIHTGEVISGDEQSVKVGAKFTLSVDALRRAAIARNHSGGHLLQKALSDVLGNHVHQAGQDVTEGKLRFDFNHFEAVTKKELEQIEQQVNEHILAALPVTVTEMSTDEARKTGAVALFGEKYGDTVRVVDMGGYSIELCGGTHVSNTSELGLFKIVSESSAAAGVRRIEAVTGFGVLEMLNGNIDALNKIAEVVKVNAVADTVQKVKAVVASERELSKENAKLKAQAAASNFESIISAGTDVNGFKVVTAQLNDVEIPAFREIGDKLKSRANIVAALSSVVGDKGNLLVVCGEDAVKAGANAGVFVRKLAQLCGGNGGGRADSAMAGAPEIFKIDEALVQFASIVQGSL